MTISYSIIIPAFNEAESIEKTIEEIKNIPGEFELIIVDDCSTDGTYELTKKTDINVIKHSVNKGYGAALKTGIRNSRSDIIVITDADGTYPNNKIPELVKIYNDEKLDMVVGARINDNVKIPLVRKPAKWFITKLAGFLAKEKIPDLNSGLRVMKKTVLNKYIRLLPEGFSFTSTITLSMLTNDYRVKYEPIDYFHRKGKSKISPFSDTINFIQLIIRTVLYFDPLRIFLPMSLPLIILGCGLILFQAIYYQNIGTIAIIITLAGIQLLAIGMIADLIVKRNL
jgi:glycosyltransferase involved in cell wall biosynthesis